MLRHTKTLSALAVGAAIFATPVALTPAFAAGGYDQVIEKVDWSFGGITGQYDKTQLRRGFQVFQNVCASCHGLSRVAFRSLSQPGGPEFTEEGVKALVAEWPHQVTAGPNDEGEMFQRQPLPTDPIVGPWKNEKEARAFNNGAYPLDLSLIARARTYSKDEPFWVQVPNMVKHIATGYEQKGHDYLYSLLIGYKEAPADFNLGEGLSYNISYPGKQIAMVQPIPEGGAVEYGEDAGAPNTMEQQSKDVVAFLAWAADPHLNTRKATGWQVMIYLLITTALLYIGKQRLWARVKKQPA
ncbi:MAG: cytochrome c1 [Pseudomonadota bacterium]